MSDNIQNTICGHAGCDREPTIIWCEGAVTPVVEWAFRCDVHGQADVETNKLAVFWLPFWELVPGPRGYRFHDQMWREVGR